MMYKNHITNNAIVVIATLALVSMSLAVAPSLVVGHKAYAQSMGVSSTMDKAMYEEVVGQHEELVSKLSTIVKCVPSSCSIVDSGHALIIVGYGQHEDNVAIEYLPYDQATSIVDKHSK